MRMHRELCWNISLRDTARKAHISRPTANLSWSGVVRTAFADEVPGKSARRLSGGTGRDLVDFGRHLMGSMGVGKFVEASRSVTAVNGGARGEASLRGYTKATAAVRVGYAARMLAHRQIVEDGTDGSIEAAQTGDMFRAVAGAAAVLVEVPADDIAVFYHPVAAVDLEQALGGGFGGGTAGDAVGELTGELLGFLLQGASMNRAIESRLMHRTLEFAI